MIELYQFPLAWGSQNASQFCLKLECYLKLSKIPYKVKNISDPRKAPKGKLPFIKDLDNQKIIADTSFIIDYLNAKFGDVLDKGLSEEQVAMSAALQRLIEDHLNWLLVYERWVDPRGWEAIKDPFFGTLPFPLKLFVPTLIRRQMVSFCDKQGVGRFTKEERRTLGEQDLNVIAVILGNKPFLLKDAPSVIDCTLWGFLAQILDTPVLADLKDIAQKIPALVEYHLRMKALFHSDG